MYLVGRLGYLVVALVLMGLLVLRVEHIGSMILPGCMETPLTAIQH
jgi:hypothetical protein